MRQLRIICLLTILAASSWFSAASADDPITLREIHELNGFDEGMAGIATSFADIGASIPEPKPEGFVEAWKTAAQAAFSSEQIIAAVETAATDKLSQDELRTLRQFFVSELGKRITAMEIAAAGSNPDQTAEGQKIFEGLAATDPERLAYYKRMLDGLDVYDSGEAMGLNIAYAVHSGMMAAAKQPVTEEFILGMIKQNRDQMRQESERTANASIAYNYRNLSLADLSRYVEFLETPAGTRYYQVLSFALDRALSVAAKDFGNQLSIALRERKA